MWPEGEEIIIEIRKTITLRATMFSASSQHGQSPGLWEWPSFGTRSPVSSSRI